MPKRSAVQETKINTPVFDAAFSDDDFFKDIDKAFTTIQMHKDRSHSTKLTASAKAAAKATGKAGVKEMQKTFKSMVQLHLSPVVRYLKAVEMGVTTKDITEIMEYVVAPLIMKSKNVGLAKETTTLIDFQRSLKKVNRSDWAKITEEETAAMTAAFNTVTKSYGLNFRGHSTAVVNVIGFFKVIKRKEKFTNSDLRKLFSIGIPSLSMLRKISLAELSSLTGLSMERCSELRTESCKFTLYIFV